MRLVLLSLLLFMGCGSEDLHVVEIECAEDGGPPRLVDTTLVVGDLNINSQFIEEDAIVEMGNTTDQVLFQVALVIDELFDYDPELLRIEFSSDQSEWIGLSALGTSVYRTEEDCLADTVYCKEIIVGEGTSGYFEIEDGMLAIQNAYCRNMGETYAYTITALVYDIAPWPIEKISEQASIEIVCHLDPDMSQTSGL